MNGRAEWVQSFVTADRRIGVYLADDEAASRSTPRISGFPANR